MPMNNPPGRSRGIALVTSLIFLAVVTVLALSAMRGVGMQEQMASNLREKSRALDAANTALRYREFWISRWVKEGEEPPQAKADGEDGVWLLGAPLEGMPQDGLDGFAADAVWSAPNVLVYEQPPFDNGTNGLIAKPRVFVEWACFEADGLDVANAAKANNPITVYYRVTGRGLGGNKTAVAVVQSTYATKVFETDVVLTTKKPCRKLYE